jgi:hypothetical protein
MHNKQVLAVDNLKKEMMDNGQGTQVVVKIKTVIVLMVRS